MPRHALGKEDRSKVLRPSHALGRFSDSTNRFLRYFTTTSRQSGSGESALLANRQTARMKDRLHQEIVLSARNVQSSAPQQQQQQTWTFLLILEHFHHTILAKLFPANFVLFLYPSRLYCCAISLVGEQFSHIL